MTRPTLRTPHASGTSRTLAIRTGAAAFALLASTAIAGCGAGFDAQTNEVRIPADGVPGGSGPIKVLNALVVADGTSGTVSLTLANTTNTTVATTDTDIGSVTLSAIRTGSAEATIGGERTIRAASSLHLGAAGTTAVFSGLDLRPGSYIPLTITLAPAQDIVLGSVPVVAATGYYATLAPSAIPAS